MTRSPALYAAFQLQDLLVYQAVSADFNSKF